MDLKMLSNGELATRMYEETKRYGELCLWMAEAELKIINMISENKQVQSEISRQLELKQGAEVEKFVALSNLKKIELEIEKRLTGDYCGAV
jgi:hypothetical protein